VVNPETGATLDAADDPVQSTYRVADALKLAPGVSAFYGQDLNEASGLNIEGIIVASGQLFAGLRAPSQNQGSFLIGIKVEDLFKPGSEPLTEAPLVAPVRLKQDQGIRDLALMDDGRFLVLSGPAQNQNVPYSLFIVDPTVKSGSGFKSDFLIDLESVPDGKAEALQIVGQTGDKLRLLVLFDSLPNGGAREYEVAIN
jgi:hypothetical protein